MWGVWELFHNSTCLVHIYNISKTLTCQSECLRHLLVHYLILYSVLHFLSLFNHWLSWLWFVLCIFQDICSPCSSLPVCVLSSYCLNIFCFVCLSFMSAFLLHQLRENLEESISQLQTQRLGRSNGVRSASASASTLHTSDLEACSGSGVEKQKAFCCQRPLAAIKLWFKTL